MSYICSVTNPTLYREALLLLAANMHRELARVEHECVRVEALRDEVNGMRDAVKSKLAMVEMELAALAHAATPDDLTAEIFSAQMALPATQVMTFTSEAPTRREWRADIQQRVYRLLRDGRYMSTIEIFAELTAQAVDFTGVRNPTHRLVQILSAAPKIMASRSKGWSMESLDFPSIDVEHASTAESPSS